MKKSIFSLILLLALNSVAFADVVSYKSEPLLLPIDSYAFDTLLVIMFALIIIIDIIFIIKKLIKIKQHNSEKQRWLGILTVLAIISCLLLVRYEYYNSSDFFSKSHGWHDDVVKSFNSQFYGYIDSSLDIKKVTNLLDKIDYVNINSMDHEITFNYKSNDGNYKTLEEVREKAKIPETPSGDIYDRENLKIDRTSIISEKNAHFYATAHYAFDGFIDAINLYKYGNVETYFIDRGMLILGIMFFPAIAVSLYNIVKNKK